MGVGKTTIGSLVAGRLQRPLRDSDLDLRTSHRNARQLAARQGVEALHRLEADLLLDALASGTPSVIAAAGSVVDDPRVVDALRSPGSPYVVWLWAPPHLLAPRLASGDHRRDLGADPVAALARLAHQRDGRYRSVADATLDVSGRRPDEVAQAIVDLVTPAGFGPGGHG
jgi:shikimate kinase